MIHIHKDWTAELAEFLIESMRYSSLHFQEYKYPPRCESRRQEMLNCTRAVSAISRDIRDELKRRQKH